MTTNELINQLKQVDPDGNLHVRINGSTPIAINKKSGYLDSPLVYKKDDKIIFSTQENRIDINTFDLEEWVRNNYKDIENKIEFFVNEQVEKNIRQEIEKFVKNAEDYEKESIQEFSNYVVNKIKDGYKIIQNNDINDMFFIKPGQEIKLRPGDCRAVIKGLFRPIKHDNHIEWEEKYERF